MLLNLVEPGRRRQVPGAAFWAGSSVRLDAGEYPYEITLAPEVLAGC